MGSKMGIDWTSRAWATWVAMGLLVGCFFTGAAQAEENRTILAVMELEDNSGTLSAKDVQTATDYLRGRLTATGRYFVIDKSRQAAALQKVVLESKKESYQECRDKECQIPLGQALSADSILRTVVLYLGGVYTIQAELVDLSKGAAIKGATVDFDEKPGEAPARSLSGALRDLVAQLAGERAPVAAPIASVRRNAGSHWAQQAGVTGIVMGVVAGGLGFAAAQTNHTGKLVPSIPLGASALVTVVVAVPLVESGGASARDGFGVPGLPIARIFGWLGYGATTLMGTSLVITGLSEKVDDSAIYSTVAVGMGSVGLMALDAFAASGQVKELRASQASGDGFQSPRVSLIPIPNERGGSDLLLGLNGRF